MTDATSRDVWQLGRSIWRRAAFVVVSLCAMSAALGYVVAALYAEHLSVWPACGLLIAAMLGMELERYLLVRTHERQMREGRELNDRIDAAIADLERRYDKIGLQ